MTVTMCLHPFVDVNNLWLHPQCWLTRSNNLFFAVQWQQQCVYLSLLMSMNLLLPDKEQQPCVCCTTTAKWHVYLHLMLTAFCFICHANQGEATTFSLLHNDSNDASTSLIPCQNLLLCLSGCMQVPAGWAVAPNANLTVLLTKLNDGYMWLWYVIHVSHLYAMVLATFQMPYMFR